MTNKKLFSTLSYIQQPNKSLFATHTIRYLLLGLFSVNSLNIYSENSSLYEDNSSIKALCFFYKNYDTTYKSKNYIDNTPNILKKKYPNWQMVTAMPSPKAEAGSIVYKNKIYVFGGVTGFIDQKQENPSKRYRIIFNPQVECYDPNTNQWTSLSPIPNIKGLSHYGICLVDNKVWLVGGRLAPRKTLTDEVWIYDIEKDAWIQGPKLPKKIASGALLKLGKKLHFFAGGTHLPFFSNKLCTTTNHHFILDLESPESEWQLFDSNFPKDAQTIHASYINLKGKFYLIGGQDGHDCGNEDFDKVYQYNPYTNEWKKVASLPISNSHAESSTFILDGQIMMAGGERNGQSILTYQCEKNEWISVDTFKDSHGKEIKLIGTSVKVIQDKMIVVGGGLFSTNYNTTDDVYVKDFMRNPQSKLGFSQDTLVIQINANTSENLQKSMWIWSLNGKTNYQIDTSELPLWLRFNSVNGYQTDENSDELIFHLYLKDIPESDHIFNVKVKALNFESANLIIIIRFEDNKTNNLYSNLIFLSKIGFLLCSFFALFLLFVAKRKVKLKMKDIS